MFSLSIVATLMMVSLSCGHVHRGLVYLVAPAWLLFLFLLCGYASASMASNSSVLDRGMAGALQEERILGAQSFEILSGVCFAPFNMKSKLGIGFQCWLT